VAANFTKGLVGMFTAMILLSTLASLIPYAFCTMAEALLSIKERRATRGAGVRLALVLPALAFVYAMIATAGAGQETVYWGFLTLLAGIPFYVLVKWRVPSSE
jgi:APA family basic amino acid/polyamine antiporter